MIRRIHILRRASVSDKNKYATVDAYIEDFPDEVSDHLRILKKCIVLAVPEAIELFNYGIPAFALVEGGKRDEQIMIAGYKKHVGLYPHPTVIEKFEEYLDKYKRGKGSIQFPIKDALPEELIVEMINYRYESIINKRL